ncbi:hypothetical protein CI109_106579 [Kwoniella shandongensis]|uniref:Uncharacterized protein n=1 Tax=Kwoniella shandongensis TaxID=1734106 RepID=A0A5M6C1Z2_9TREE|nr:uncharacterized protein CI109_002761 [Kwoniella shandongensis]KAA5529003.1 hypothetical protein CI109_002761 [Kwoniella shandongensis]
MSASAPAPSTPPRHRPAFAPRPDAHPRDSGFNSIGNLLSTPYDTDDSDGEELVTPYNQSPINERRPSPLPTATTEGHNDVLEARVKSYESGIHTDYSDDDDGSTIRFKPHTPIKEGTRWSGASRQRHQSVESRPPTIVEFPEPSLQPSQGHGFGYPQSTASGTTAALRPSMSRSTSNPNVGPNTQQHREVPRTPTRSRTVPDPSSMGYPPSPSTNYHLSPHHRPTQPQISITTTFPLTSPQRSFVLPPPSSPISPLLAAPPKSHISPLSPPISPFATSSGGGSGGRSRSSSTSESIRGFDIMTEKKALFREGHEELMSPFSPRMKGMKPLALASESGLRNGGTRRASGMDFWKRFSVSVRVDEAQRKDGGDSTWLAQAHQTRGQIKKMIFVGLLLTTCLVVILVVYFTTRD